MSSARKQRLDAVFTKAIDMSVNGVGEPELEECFGGIKAKFGAQLQNQYVNMIAKTQRSMEAAYGDICTRHDIDAKLRALETAKVPTRDADAISDDPLSSTVDELRQIEAEELATAIKLMEADIKRLNDVAGRLRAHVLNEIAAATEEGQKIASAAAQCSS